MFNKRFIILSFLVLSSRCFAEEDNLASLNDKIKRLDELHIRQEIQRTFSQLDAIEAQTKKAAAPQAPSSPIPMPGQAVAPIPPNYTAPIPGARIPNHFIPPAANNPATPPNTLPNNIYR